MKKITFIIFFLAAFAVTGCGGKGNGQTASATTAVVTAPADETNAGKVIYLSTDQFKKLVWDYKQNPDKWVFKGDLPVVIDFYADWCRPCRMVAPIMDELAQTYKGKVIFYKVNTDMERELSSTFQIRSIPAILYIPRTGQPKMAVGLQSKDAYIQAINEILNSK